jgi:HSP20 family protein
MQMEYTGNRRRPGMMPRGFRDDFEQWMGALRFAPQIDFPPVNIWTGADGAIVTAEIPGINSDQLDITVHGETVTLRGTREPEHLEGKAVPRRQERIYGAFTRTIVLPYRVDPDNVVARFERGVLFLELPRPAADKPRHIKVAHA